MRNCKAEARINQPGIGPLLASGSPVVWSDHPRLPPAPAPRLGADTEAILGDVLGLGSGEIGRLMDARVVAGP